MMFVKSILAIAGLATTVLDGVVAAPAGKAITMCFDAPQHLHPAEACTTFIDGLHAPTNAPVHRIVGPNEQSDTFSAVPIWPTTGTISISEYSSAGKSHTVEPVDPTHPAGFPMLVPPSTSKSAHFDDSNTFTLPVVPTHLAGSYMIKPRSTIDSGDPGMAKPSPSSPSTQPSPSFPDPSPPPLAILATPTMVLTNLSSQSLLSSTRPTPQVSTTLSLVLLATSLRATRSQSSL